jgi:O-acetylhomoserine (thiol)-lyase
MPAIYLRCKSTAISIAELVIQLFQPLRKRLLHSKVASVRLQHLADMAAQFLTFAALVGAGDHVVASSALYGGTVTQLDVTLRRFGVDTTFIKSDKAEDFKAAITDKTKFIYAEMISNPASQISDIEALAKVAHDAGLPLVIDSTVATPYLVRPIEYGADIVLHSATKFLGGHGTTLGGVIVESGKFNWGNGKFPTMTEPVASYGGVSWWENFGEFGFLTKLRSEQLRDVGASLSAMSAFHACARCGNSATAHARSRCQCQSCFRMARK